jgi:hypothetical protein
MLQCTPTQHNNKRKKEREKTSSQEARKGVQVMNDSDLD